MPNQKSFAQDVLTLTSVPVISQILGILLTPIVTRLYGPEIFGLVNVFGSIVMLFAVFSTMGYDGAIILPKADTTASSILIICFFSMLCISAISFLIVMAGKDIISAKLNAPVLAKYLWLTPIYVFFHGMYMTLRFWKTRLRHFENLAMSRVGEIVVRKSYQIPAGFLGYPTVGNLLVADLVAAIVKNLILIKNMGLRTISLKNKSYLKLWTLAKRYKKFPKYNIWADLFSRLPQVIISLLIIKYFGQNILGYYGISMMVLYLPFFLISGSISEAFIPRAAMAKHDNEHVELLSKLYVRLVALMIFPFMILALFSNKLFPFIFGPEWMMSGLIAQILVFRIFLETIFSPPISLIDIIEKQELNVIRSITRIMITIVAFLVGIYYNNIFLAFWCISLLEGTLIIIIGGYVMNLINFPFFLAMKKISIYVFLTVFLSFLLFLLNNLFITNIFYLIGIIGIATLFYYATLAYLDQVIMKSIIQALRSLLKF